MRVATMLKLLSWLQSGKATSETPTQAARIAGELQPTQVPQQSEWRRLFESSATAGEGRIKKGELVDAVRTDPVFAAGVGLPSKFQEEEELRDCIDKLLRKTHSDCDCLLSWEQFLACVERTRVDVEYVVASEELSRSIAAAKLRVGATQAATAVDVAVGDADMLALAGVGVGGSHKRQAPEEEDHNGQQPSPSPEKKRRRATEAGSYCKQTDSDRYDHSLLEQAEAFEKAGGVISHREARDLWEAAQDRMGMIECQTRTLVYCLAAFSFTPRAAEDLNTLLAGGQVLEDEAQELQEVV